MTMQDGVDKLRNLLRDNPQFREDMRQNPSAALEKHQIELPPEIHQRVLGLNWNVDDDEMTERSHTPS